jgi:hypothetical protein
MPIWDFEIVRGPVNHDVEGSFCRDDPPQEAGLLCLDEHTVQSGFWFLELESVGLGKTLRSVSDLRGLCMFP